MYGTDSRLQTTTTANSEQRTEWVDTENDGHRPEHDATRRHRFVKYFEQRRRHRTWMHVDGRVCRTGFWERGVARRYCALLIFFLNRWTPRIVVSCAPAGPVSAARRAALVTRPCNEWYPGTGRHVRLATVCSRDQRCDESYGNDVTLFDVRMLRRYTLR